MAHRFNPDRLHRLNDPEREKMLDPDLLWEGFGAESPGSVDLAYLIDVYHELEDAPRMLGELLRLLKPGAPLAVVDWKKEPMPHGPPVARRVEEEAIKRQMERAGLAGVAEPASLPFHAFLTGHKEPAGRQAVPSPGVPVQDARVCTGCGVGPFSGWPVFEEV